MNKFNKQVINILKIFKSKIRKRISLFVSLCLMLLLSAALIFSLFLSDQTLENLAQSNYFQSRVTKALEENEISSKGLLFIKFNKYSSADIIVEKANLSRSKNLVGYDVTLKVDFIKYWLGLHFIDEISIKEVEYMIPNGLSFNLNDINRVGVKSLFPSLHNSLYKINSKSIYIEKGTVKLQNQTLYLEEIYLNNNETLLTAKASLKVKPNSDEVIYTTQLNFSMNSANIVKFNIGFQVIDFINFLYFEGIPKEVRLFFRKLIKNSNLSDKKKHEVHAVGTYNLDSTTLDFELADLLNLFKLSSSAKLSEFFQNNTLSLRNTELVLGDHSLSANNFDYDFVKHSFETNVTKVITPYEKSSFLPKKFKVFGIFPYENRIISKIHILGENPSNLKASLKIIEPTIGIDNGQASIDFFVKVDSLRKIDLNKFGFSLDFITKGEKNEISLSNADAKFQVEFVNKSVKLNLFEGKINKLVYFENNKPLVELDDIGFEGNLNKGYVAIASITKIEPSVNIYRDIEVEFSSTENVEHKKEITLSMKSSLSDLIYLMPNVGFNINWINSLVRSQGKKEVSITYSKEIAFNNIEKFFALEENLFELDIENLQIPLNAKNSIDLDKLNLKSAGNTVFFEGLMASNNKKISGSINNWFSNTFTDSKFDNLVIFFDNLNSEALFPDFSTFNVNGPMKLTFSSGDQDDKVLVQSKLDLTKAEVIVPALTLKKVKGKFGQLKLDFTKDNRSLFEYSQNDVLVSGSASHKASFEIKKVVYSSIKTPDIRIEKATFQKFGEYNQFKANRGTISLEFLMRLNLKRKDIPVDIIFSDINLTFKTSKFLESLKGEIRSFNGLRGYAKAKLSQTSNLEITISPKKNHEINLVLSGSDAGELLRRGKYYENGYGGLFRASIFYKSRAKISGSLNIEGFRIRNAPVLAQIISSASIIGLLDNLNGNGLLFTKIEGSFNYEDGKLTLEDGVAVGPSLGLTMGGYERYGKKQNTVNVSGLVSPVYIINGVVKAIPLIGKVLGGEKGEGVFGVSYKVQGNSSNPRVLVNPLSILTPGVFRRIFNIQGNGKR